MVQYTQTCFDTSFAALSDVTRRGVLEQLGRADASITDLAEKFHMTLTGMKKHVGVLGKAGFWTRGKVGGFGPGKLGRGGLGEGRGWFESYGKPWADRLEGWTKVTEEWKRRGKADEGR